MDASLPASSGHNLDLGAFDIQNHSMPNPLQEPIMQAAEKVYDPSIKANLIAPDDSVQCHVQPYDIYTFSESPSVIYIRYFVSESEREDIIQASEPEFRPSMVYEQGEIQLNEGHRRSEIAWPARNDVVKCIERRAQQLQNWDSHMKIEPFSVQRYQQNGHFNHHHDSFDTAPALADRLSTFNVYLDSNCTGGGTHFPHLSMPEDRSWCEFVDCEASEPGVVFKAIAGNAVYWQNFGDDGARYPATFHAGLSVLSGRKIGMNIWTWLIP